MCVCSNKNYTIAFFQSLQNGIFQICSKPQGLTHTQQYPADQTFRERDLAKKNEPAAISGDRPNIPVGKRLLPSCHNFLVWIYNNAGPDRSAAWVVRNTTCTWSILSIAAIPNRIVKQYKAIVQERLYINILWIFSTYQWFLQ